MIKASWPMIFAHDLWKIRVHLESRTSWKCINLLYGHYQNFQKIVILLKCDPHFELFFKSFQSPTDESTVVVVFLIIFAPSSGAKIKVKDGFMHSSIFCFSLSYLPFLRSIHLARPCDWSKNASTENKPTMLICNGVLFFNCNGQQVVLGFYFILFFSKLGRAKRTDYGMK